MINNSPIDILRRFSDQAKKLEDKKFDELSNFSFKMSFLANEDGFGSVSSKLPNEDIIKLFLMDFRFFYIKKENPFNFKNICQFFIDNDFEVEKTNDFLKAYEKVFLNKSMGLRVGDKELTTKKIFEIILNEEHFHQELKQKGLDIIKSSIFVEPMARLKFFELISKLRLLICGFNRQVVDKYLEMK